MRLCKLIQRADRGPQVTGAATLKCVWLSGGLLNNTKVKLHCTFWLILASYHAYILCLEKGNCWTIGNVKLRVPERYHYLR